MKKTIALLTCLGAISACNTVDFKAAADRAVTAGMDGLVPTFGAGGNNTGSTANNSGGTRTSSSKSALKITISDAKRTKRDIGKIYISKTEKNARKQTRIVFDSCSNPRVGIVNCDANAFEISNDGFLINDSEFFTNYSSWREEVMPAGSYYIKADSADGNSGYATGTIIIKPFVTNYFSVELEK